MQSNELFTQRHTILLDGGMGTMLQAAGLKLGARPEELNITDPEAITRIHSMYAAAGQPHHQHQYLRRVGPQAGKKPLHRGGGHRRGRGLLQKGLRPLRRTDGTGYRPAGRAAGAQRYPAL